MENFAWTRLAGVTMPAKQKPLADINRLRLLGPRGMRESLVDGNYGGLYQRSDEEMQAIWSVAVEETRELIANGWA
jgi:creatinine amidohydrolase